jgi:hypothetical protein
MHDRAQSISQRMVQAFLDSRNSYNGVPFNNEDEDFDWPRLPKRFQQEQHQQFRRQQNGLAEERGPTFDQSRGHDLADEPAYINSTVQPESRRVSLGSNMNFFQLLRFSQDVDEQVSARSNEDILAWCGGLLYRTYPNSTSACMDLISKIEPAVSERTESATLFLDTVHRILTTRKHKTIQEHLASQDHKHMDLQIRFLALCVRGLKYASCEKTPAILARESADNFLAMLILQLVEILYSIFLSSAWALKHVDTLQILRELIPLRDALADSGSLTESVSRCIIERLGCQLWRRSECGSHVFVSSIDPGKWSTFLRSGKSPAMPQQIRYLELGKIWPRVEIGLKSMPFGDSWHMSVPGAIGKNKDHFYAGR